MATESFENLFDFIKATPFIKSDEYKKVKNNLYDGLFCKIPIVTNKIKKGDFLFRTLPIEREDLTIGRKSYLSYRPKDIQYNYFNRCSEPNQTHFYCSTYRPLSIFEVSYFNSKKNIEAKNAKDNELLELGMWEVLEDIYVADLTYGNFSHGDATEFKEMIKNEYKKSVKDKSTIEFFKYLNISFETPIRKEEHFKYWFTACYSNYLFDERFNVQGDFGTLPELKSIENVAVDGIMYHSVKGLTTKPPIEGYNVCLRTELIDNKIIQLRKAGIFLTENKGDKTIDLDKLLKFNDHIIQDSWYYDDYVYKNDMDVSY